MAETNDIRNDSTPTAIAAIAWLLVITGIALRVARYMIDRSLWTDEARLALNIIHRDIAGLMGKLDYGQGAPFGFLLIEKSLTQAFGDGEYVLRFVPMLASVLCVPVFYLLAKRCLRPWTTLVAVALFAVSEPLVHYAAELKQYSLDLLIALLLMWLAALLSEKRTATRWVALIIVGMLGVWMSHTALFVSAGVGCALMFNEWRAGGVKRALPVAGVSLLWAISFAMCYVVILRHASDSAYLREYWKDAFVPMPPKSIDDVRWYASTFFGVFEDPAGLKPKIFAAALGLVGVVALLLRRRALWLVLILPIVFVLLASMAQQFPFRSLRSGEVPYAGRVILFVTPAVFILVAAGIGELSRVAGRVGQMAAVIAGAVVLALPVSTAAYQLTHPPRLQELRPVMQAMGEKFQQGDLIYMYMQSEPAFDYYHTRTSMRSHDVQPTKLLWPRRDFTLYENDLADLKSGDRVWLVYSYHNQWTSRKEQEAIARMLDTMGARLEQVETEGASAQLFRIDDPVNELPPSTDAP